VEVELPQALAPMCSAVETAMNHVVSSQQGVVTDQPQTGAAPKAAPDLRLVGRAGAVTGLLALMFALSTVSFAQDCNCNGRCSHHAGAAMSGAPGGAVAFQMCMSNCERSCPEPSRQDVAPPPNDNVAYSRHTINPLYLGAFESISSPADEQRVRAHFRQMGLGKAKFLTCVYGSSTGVHFWYGSVPVPRQELLKIYAQHPLRWLGDKPMTACPATLAQANAARR
jgi:hypothetical protein